VDAVSVFLNSLPKCEETGLLIYMFPAAGPLVQPIKLGYEVRILPCKATSSL
jgi:hypothetical protein